MRNRQAQFIPAASEPLGLIKPIDPKYGYMAQPKKADLPLLKPIEGGSYLFQQTNEWNSERMKVEQEYSQVMQGINNIASSFPGGADAFMRSTDPDIIKQRNNILGTIDMLNKKKNILQSSESTLKGNLEQFNIDVNTADPTKPAITANGVYTQSIEQKEINGKKVNFRTVQPYSVSQILNDGSLSARDVLKTHNYHEWTNNDLNFIDPRTGNVRKYDNILKIDANEQEGIITDMTKSVGQTEIAWKKGKKDTWKGGAAGITFYSTSKDNLQQLESVLFDFANVRNMSSNNLTYNYLFSEYVQYMDQNGQIPLMKPKKRTEAEVKEGVNPIKPQFEIEYQTNDKDEIEYSKTLNNEGFQSFVLNKIVKKLNPEIDILEDAGSDIKSVASSTPLEEKIEEVGEWDKARLDVATSYSQRMATTYTDRTIQQANNSAKSTLPTIYASLGVTYDSSKYNPIFKGIELSQQERVKFAENNKSRTFTTKEDANAYWDEDMALLNEITKGIGNLIKQIKTDTNYDGLSETQKLKADEQISKVVSRLYDPAVDNIFTTKYMDQSAGWTTLFKDFSNLSDAAMQGDVFFANGQPIEQTKAKKNGVSLVMTTRYSPNLINYDMNVSTSSGATVKWYQAPTNKRWGFFNQDAKKRGEVTREAWENVFAVNEEDFKTTMWVLEGADGKKVNKLGEDLSDDEKIQLGIITNFAQHAPLVKHKQKVKDAGEGNVVYMKAISYDLKNRVKTGGTEKAVDRNASVNP
jgi:hypothetical protein